MNHQSLIRRELHPKATVPVDQAGPVIDFRSSDQSLDRYQELITVGGWKLENYKRNPVVQNAHSYCSLSDTIGKSLITEIRGTPDSSGPERGLQSAGTLNAPTLSRSTLHAPTPYLFQRILFAVDENPMAKVAYGLYKGGFLNAVSVGFIPLRWENGSQEKGYQRKYLEQELVEVSAVSIPANPNALTLALKSGAIEKSDLKELFELLKHFCSSRAGVSPASSGAGVPPAASGPSGAGFQPASGSPLSTQEPINSQQFRNEEADRTPDTSALGSAIDEAHLLQLTRQLNEIRAILKKA